MFEEFKKFAIRGNVMDMAIGIIIGAAFGKIVTSFVNDILMPPLGLLVGDADFSDLFVTLSGPAADTLEAAKEAGAVTLNYGAWLNTVVDFTIVAFAIFIVVKQINRLKEEEKKPEVPKPPEPTAEEKLLAEIRDLLKARA